jgi:hypothetical protein
MPVINPFGVVAGTLSAGTTKATLGEVVFSNSNGVSFGINGQTITASVAGGGGGNTGSISAGTTRLTLGEAVFSNANGLSFGINGQTITGSYTVPSTAGLLSNINVSAGTTSNDLSNLVFSNDNNVSFGLNGSTVTASIATSLTNIRVSAGTTSNDLSSLVFSNGNNVSFGLNGSTITGSVATSLTNINVSAGTTSNNLSAITFSNANGFSFGLNGSVITGSYTVPIVTNSSWTVSDANTSGTVARLAFTNLNGVTLSLSTGTGGLHTIVGSHNAITSQTNQTVGLYAVGNTTGESSSSTFDARTISFVGQGVASVGFSNGSVNISVPSGGGNTGSISAGTTRLTLGEAVFSNANGVSFGINGQTVTASIATSLTNIRVSAGTTSNLLSAITFSDSNGISFGLNASTITASYTVPTVTNSSWTVSDAATSGTVARLAFTNLNNVTLSLSTGAGGSHTIVGSVATSLTNIRVSAGTTSNLLSAITFSNSNGVSFGLNASTLTASIATSLTAINVSAGTTSNNLSAITFSNSNGISFGLNASTITASYTVPGTLSVFAQSNTTLSSSGTIPFNSLQFNGAGIASVGVSNGSVVISVPAGGGEALPKRYLQLEAFRFSLSNLTNLTAITNVPFFIPMFNPGNLTVSRINWEMSRATNGSNLFTVTAGFYTYVNSTQISLLTSFSASFSNTATASVNSIRKFEMVPSATFSLTPGEYVYGMEFNATATASINYSIRGFSGAVEAGGVVGGADSYNTAVTDNIVPFFGRYSTTVTFPNSVARSQILGQFSGASAPIGAWIAILSS